MYTQVSNHLKEHISTDISLQIFDFSKPLYIKIDGSKKGIGSVMLQPDNIVKDTSPGDIQNNLCPVAYAPRHSVKLNLITVTSKGNC